MSGLFVGARFATTSLGLALFATACGDAGARPSPVVVSVAPVPLPAAPSSSATVAPQASALPWIKSSGPVGTHEAERCAEGSLVAEAEISTPVRGHFTAVDADEVYGWISCDEGTLDLGAYGVFRKTARGLELVSFTRLFDSRMARIDCLALASTGGRDLLACRESSGMYGVIDQSVVVFDFTKDEDTRETRLVRALDSTDTACTGQTDLLLGGIDRIERIDANHDGLADLRVTVRERAVHVKPQPPCAQMGSVGAGQVPPNLPAAPAAKLDFTQGPKGFEPVASAVARVREIAKLVEANPP